MAPSSAIITFEIYFTLYQREVITSLMPVFLDTFQANMLPLKLESFSSDQLSLKILIYKLAARLKIE